MEGRSWATAHRGRYVDTTETLYTSRGYSKHGGIFVIVLNYFLHAKPVTPNTISEHREEYTLSRKLKKGFQLVRMILLVQVMDPCRAAGSSA